MQNQTKGGLDNTNRITNNGESTLVQLVGENLVKEKIYIDGDNINRDSNIKNLKYSTVFSID